MTDDWDFDDDDPRAVVERLRERHAAIWIEDDMTGFPWWSAEVASGAEGHEHAGIYWGDGDGIAEFHMHCMHAHGTAGDLARFVGACNPQAISTLLAYVDSLAEQADEAMARLAALTTPNKEAHK
jgi:hypothetical protein